MEWEEVMAKSDNDILKILLRDVDSSWNEMFSMENMKEHILNAIKIIRDDEKMFREYFKIFPPPNLVFNAFVKCPSDVKVVILGQDPYHQPGQAMGLSFSVPNGIKIPPSLKNIYKEMADDLVGWTDPGHGDLSSLTEDGVLLLNSSLTVLESKPLRHAKQWKPFTDEVIKYVWSE